VPQSSTLIRHLLIISIVAAPELALAHIELSSPPNRYGDEQKTGPCGRADGERSTNVTTYEPGATISVSWDETVNHPSHYRISFDDDGDDGFVDPAEMMEFYSNEAVLIDEIPDSDTRQYEVAVTLPEIECENCTLQLIQVMYDKPPYTIPGNDIYYNCADLVLKSGGGNQPGADAGPDIGTDPPGMTSGGCAASGHRPSWLWLAPLALLFAVRRARR